ncbi:protein LURP-one-related 8-like [Vigna umbellata]|uniref:Protein LURP-one-related 8 n=2 Tax=Phaseolus angularis TaxID=3914 RepID=A0A0L9VUV6_PHAAN|nr:protein LURP-one-related 8 [Vigna angularis]XP_047153054.1 protein LURP-one-related 8-like [Vigna umbellata]KAG2381242.1 Protein LURP-one-related 8 [Vigna angularis]KOM58723.1 hypothetical protein LR48_Vigan11g175700 [Vigna angularis]BAT96727.1 hypothetical protein VIGAN_09000800 [Vigna angularis var. angularis]
MRKVHPGACVSETAWERSNSGVGGGGGDDAVVLTVWKKSLLPNCHGFTVFDTNRGNLVFRVDNYIGGNKDHILLMDAAGTPLLTIRRKRLSLGDTWLVFEGEDESLKPLFTARKSVSILNNSNNKCLAHLLSSFGTGNMKKEVAYEIEGCYARRCCTFYSKNRRKVAEIKMKEGEAGGIVFGADIFRLIVQPEMDTALAMAFLILLDHMFGSR